MLRVSFFVLFRKAIGLAMVYVDKGSTDGMWDEDEVRCIGSRRKGR